MSPFPTVRRPALLLAAGALVTSACGAGGAATGSAPRDVTAASPVAAVATDGQGQQCRDDELGYRVSYPDGWRTNPGEVLPACRLFDPAAIRVEAGTEVPLDIAVMIHPSPAPLDQFTASGHAAEVVATWETTVDGHDAVAVELRATGRAMLPEDARTYLYAVDLGDRRLVASTHDPGPPPYAHAREVLDAMMASMQLTADT